MAYASFGFYASFLTVLSIVLSLVVLGGWTDLKYKALKLIVNCMTNTVHGILFLRVGCSIRYVG